MKLQQKKHPKLTILLKILLISTGVLLLLAPIAYITYQKYLENQEAKNFAALKVDFLELQKEFNKIDPGWEYSERCVGQGGPFTDSIASSCRVGIKNVLNGTNQQLNKEYVDILLLSNLHLQNENKFTITDKDYTEYQIIHEAYRGANCGLVQIVSSVSTEYLLGCSDSARKFYYERIDR